MNRRVLRALALVLLAVTSESLWAAGKEPVLWWSFDEQTAGTVKDAACDAKDIIDGNHKYMPGPSGSALKPDGFTTCIERKAANAPSLDSAFTVEAWIAQAAYPWNWCPVIAQQDAQNKGYRLAVGPNGDFSLEVAVGGKWQRCVSEKNLLPLREWTHIAGTYDPEKGITLFANGKDAGHLDVKGKPDWARDANIRALMNYEKTKPSDIHRPFGTLPGWFSIDGLVDEIKLFDTALEAERIKEEAAPRDKLASPALPPRKMPYGPEGAGRFGAYYCKLKYYEEWDNLWRVDEHPDIVVRFDQSATRVVFWRGTRYSPAWVSENGLWMADQSVETWNRTQGCYEHMQDRRCRYSHVRIIESNDARVVVHWRYAPVSAHDEIAGEDEKTTRACWIDEYYYIYPDQMGIRKPTWKTGTLPRPVQFQESLPFTDSGQFQDDVINKDFATVANFKGQTETLSFVENPARRQMPADLTIQRYNFRSKNRPSIIFEPGDRMSRAADRQMPSKGLHVPGSCNHWPVGQAACDGRTAQAPDRPTHFLGFPISYPPIHEKDGRSWWNGLYSMTEMDMAGLVLAGRSWACAPKLILKSKGFQCLDYDRAERAYQLSKDKPGADGILELTLDASDDSPAFNPALVVKDWHPQSLKLKLDGKETPRGGDFRAGARPTLEGEDVIIWIRTKSTKPLTIELSAEQAGAR